MSSEIRNGKSEVNLEDGRGRHVLVWDQEQIKHSNKPKGWFGTRHFVTIMLCLGMANAYTMRTNMSVAIVAMVNHSALPKEVELVTDECEGRPDMNDSSSAEEYVKDGEFIWDTKQQGFILSTFFYGYVFTQIPFGILAKKYGSRLFLGWGMMLNSVTGLLVPLAAKYGGMYTLAFVRFIQGLGEGPIVPCSHALLAKWIPPNERSRMGAIVYAGAQFGTVISMPLSGILSDDAFGGWPSVFYFFGIISLIWSVAFLMTVHEDPEQHPTMDDVERKYIINTVWGDAGVNNPPIPWKSILSSVPFWAIMLAHIGHNYGYETLMTELPTFMKQVLRFKIKENGILSAVPYLSMWGFSLVSSSIADHYIAKGKSRTIVRKISNAFGHYGPALALIAASYTGCNPYLTVAILSLGVGLNGSIYSGFKISHLDISPRFAGILMSFTNCTANLTGLLAPLVAGYIIHGRPNQEAWREVFFVAAGVYIVCNTCYIALGSSKRQPWDNPDNDKQDIKNSAAEEKTELKENVL